MSEILRKAILFFLLCSSVGWLFLGASIQSRRDRRKKIESERARATGTIVDYVPQKRGQPHPVVEFTAYGRVNRLECPVELDPGELPVGAQVEVLHHPDDPSRFHLEQYEADDSGARVLWRIGFIWMACSAALTLALMTLVGGYRIDLGPVNRILHLPARTSGRSAKTVAQNDGDFKYTVDEKGRATLTQYTGSASSLQLPTIVDGHVVSGLGFMVFSHNTSLTEVTVPGIYSSVSHAAFAGCMNLSDVTLKDGVSSIGMRAFFPCPVLANVTLPKNLTSIADDAFPDDCAATFHVVEGSAAERYCRRKGFAIELVEP